MSNFNEIGRRIRELRDFLQIKQGDMAKIIDIDQGFLSNIEKGSRRLPFDAFDKLETSYPGLNFNWLLFGIGSMFNDKDSDTISVPPTPKLPHLSDQDPHLSPQKHTKNNILVPIAAQAGAGIAVQDEWIDQEPVYVDIPGISGELRTYEVMGTSMEPALIDGDYVVCSRLPGLNYIRPDHIYVLVEKSGMCHIKLIELQHDRCQLRPLNIPEYDPYTIAYEDIREVWKAERRITAQFTVSRSPVKDLSDRTYMIERFLRAQFPDKYPSA